jgi:hypothetical protein
MVVEEIENAEYRNRQGQQDLSSEEAGGLFRWAL